MGFLRLVSLGLAVMTVAPAFAQLNNLNEAMRTTPITTQELAPNFNVLFGVGGNILVSFGANGVLIVDAVTEAIIRSAEIHVPEKVRKA